jgi:hypothetical protein
VKIVRLVLATLLVASAMSVLAAPACSPSQVIAQHIQWLNASKNNVVHVAAVSNQNNRLVSYAEGQLEITGQPFPGAKKVTYLGGTLEQFFSDRRYALATVGAAAVPRHPFSPKLTDTISLTISSEASIGLSLKSWNNAVVALTDVQCAAGVLYGFTNNPTGPRSFYLISMSKGVNAATAQVR